MSNSLSQRDKQSVWHPFTPQGDGQVALAIVSGKGALLFDESGKEYIDAIASWWVNLHGHSHPYIAQKISNQLFVLEHAIFSGYTHEPAVVLAERLLKSLPSMNKVFYSDDGSTSVEVALKMALQYWHNKGNRKTKIIAFENAYHGDTFGGMSVGARNVFNNSFEPLLFDVVHIPVPVKGREKDSCEALEKALDAQTAAFIYEPLVQGAAGMIMYDESSLNELLSICKKRNVITIADEVMTGFGRTGKMFASDHCANKPDIVCLSKGLTGGFLPLGATLCNEEIYSAFTTTDKVKTFFHGHSYTANPLVCTAANASLDVFEMEKCMKRVGEIEQEFRKQCDEFSKHPKVKDARCRGTILALELRTAEATEYLNPIADRIHAFFPERGIILRPLGNVLYVLPPYCITDVQIQKIFDIMFEFLTTL